jgi:RimJ/RimL family protein N-acetyltransferase
VNTSLVFDLPSVLPFVQRHCPGLHETGDMVAIGLAVDEKLVAGVLFDGFNGANVWMHVAAQPGARWMTRAYLLACFAYPFNICRVKRISGYVNASNLAAQRFDEHLGFKEEARLQGAAPDGGDVIIYAMWRKDCRFIGDKENHVDPQ